MLTTEEAMELAREVRENRSRSYVRAAHDLAEFVLSHAARLSSEKAGENCGAGRDDDDAQA